VAKTADGIDLGVCSECGEEVVSLTKRADLVWHAPDWHGWPVPPPIEYERALILGHDVEERCDAGHVTKRYEHFERGDGS
jgi:hypothetical protein